MSGPIEKKAEAQKQNHIEGLIEQQQMELQENSIEFLREQEKERQISRVKGILEQDVIPLLRHVRFNAAGLPATTEDKKNHEWNLRFIETFSKQDNYADRVKVLKEVYQTAWDFEVPEYTGDEDKLMLWVTAHPAEYRQLWDLLEGHQKLVKAKIPEYRDLFKQYEENGAVRKFTLVSRFMNYIDTLLKIRGVKMGFEKSKEAFASVSEENMQRWAGRVYEFREKYEASLKEYHSGKAE